MIGDQQLGFQSLANTGAVIRRHLIGGAGSVAAHIEDCHIDVILLGNCHIAVMIPGIAHKEDVAGAGLEQIAAGSFLEGQQHIAFTGLNGGLIVADQEIYLSALHLDRFADLGNHDAVIGDTEALQLLYSHGRRIKRSVSSGRHSLHSIQVTVILVGMGAENTINMVELPRINYLRIQADPVDAVSAGLLAHTAVVQFCIHRGTAVLVNHKDAALIGLQNPGGAAAPPKADLLLGHFVVLNLLI